MMMMMMKMITRSGRRAVAALALALALLVPGAVPARADDGAPVESRIYGPILTWSDDPATTVNVTWIRTRSTAPPPAVDDPDPAAVPEARVWLRAPGETWMRATGVTRPFGPSGDPSGDLVQTVAIEGLLPGAIYEFAAGGDEPAPGATLRRFRTAPADPARAISFVTGGDMYHNRSWLDDMNRRAGELAPAFALLGGDLAYANGVDSGRWRDWVESWSMNAVTPEGLMVPLIAAIGNHEVNPEAASTKPEDRAPYYYSLFTLPGGRSYFAIDLGPEMSVIVLDSDHTVAVAGAQTEWLRGALEARRDRPLVFVCYHRPYFGTAKEPHAPIGEHWIPLFDRYRPAIVFENDHHTYKRTPPIRFGRVDRESGVTYAGDGAWGVELREVPAPGTVWHLERAESRRHLIHVVVEDGTVRGEAVDAEGAVFDRWPAPAPRPAADDVRETARPLQGSVGG